MCLFYIQHQPGLTKLPKLKGNITMKNQTNSAAVLNNNQNNNMRPEPKRSISGVQFRAVQKAVDSVISDAVPESTRQAVTRSAVYGVKLGERAELLLQVESERIIDARHVEVRFVDGGGRRYIWSGTTGQAARLKPGQVVVLKASAVNQDKEGMHIKHCRISEVA